MDRSGKFEFWLESITGVVIALFLFAFGQSQLGWITVIIAFFQALSRYKYTKQLDDELAPVKKMTDLFDLTNEMDVDSLRTVVAMYAKITEADFLDVKESIVSETIKKLSSLALDKRSETLATGRYYHWLLPMIESASVGSSIWAISMMLDCEWDDTPPERRFLEYNLAAARRGVRVERVFVVPRDQIPGLITVPPVVAQLNGEVRVLLVEREQLERQDPDTLRAIGDGLIAFDRRVVLIDEHSIDGRARGFVTMNPGDISTWRSTYESLLQHAEPMRDVLSSKKIDIPRETPGSDGAVAAGAE